MQTASIFISHASEDTDSVAIPLAERLRALGLEVWLDQWELTLGAGLRSAIEKALSEASFGVVIISPDYMREVIVDGRIDGSVEGVSVYPITL